MFSPPAARGSGGQGQPILVVDDDADQRAAVAGLLSGRGYDVVVAVDGQDAWEMLARGLRPGLIVLDLTMPRMDGWSFLERLQGTVHEAVPVIVTSAVAANRPPPGADACLEKPFEAAQLRALVARFASRPRRTHLERS
jgi:CheY-like chemotaxis protein